VNKTLLPTVFLDRDGTVNIDRGYVYRPEDFEFIPGAEKAIARLNRRGFLVIVVSNQSGVARGYYTEENINDLQRYIDERLIEVGAHIDAYYYCPHYVQKNGLRSRFACDCRKPQIGLYHRAIKEWSVDKSRSWMVGDKLDDMQFARSANLRGILVGTGQIVTRPPNVNFVSSIVEAVDMILSYPFGQSRC
jgi:D-glycero-D-manno-heptose 1,7-bisphosphate phosphatase